MSAGTKSPKRRFGAPWLMSGSFALAIIFAAAHHAFYASLNGEKVSSVTFNQQVNVAGGTAFAFLVRAFLVVAIGTAYAQILWRVLLDPENQLSIATIDSLSSLLSSVVELVHIQSFRRYPTLMLIGLIAWIIPFSTIVPPATLSVHTELHTTYNLHNVTTIDWNKGTGFGGVSGLYSLPPGDYAGPQGEQGHKAAGFRVRVTTPASNIGVVTADQGKLPSLPMPPVNASYRIALAGPALKCENIAADTVLGNWSHHCLYKTNETEPHNIRTTAGYFSWIPEAMSFGGGAEFDVVPQLANGRIDCTNLALQAGDPLTMFSNRPPQLFVAIQVGWDNETLNDFWSLTRCELHNATYTIEFTSGNEAQQNVSVISRELTPLKPTSDYLGIHPSGQVSKTPTTNIIYNYLATMCMLNMVVGGVLSVKVPDEDEISHPILNTQLALTKEFIEFFNHGPYSDQPDLTWGDSSPVPDWTSFKANKSFAPTLEELHQNLTLALFSFDPVASNTELSNVSTWRSHNVYVYTWQHLLLSYGLGILIAGVAIAYGIYTTLMVAGASYTTRFSTYLRTVHWEEVSTLVSPNYSYDGADPLPKTIARETVEFGPVIPDTSDS